ncbi:hypothetical protein [Phenylobacterium sp.]|jgi:hypothetical protein|uniref:hypothetical protein n=1 Tax=Phenylobacterium sp. TaxID=1871053 RepID=UPI0035B38DE3
MYRSFALFVLLVGVSSPVQAAPGFTDVYRIRVVSGHYTGLYESLALRQVWSKDGPFWMAERRTRTTAGVTGPTYRVERAWIDGRRCPALEGVVQRVAAIPPPSPTSTLPPFHGAHVYLAAQGPDGGYSIRSDYEGPVTAWWREAGNALQPCWGHLSTTVDDDLLPLTLEQDADEAPFRALESAR